MRATPQRAESPVSEGEGGEISAGDGKQERKVGLEIEIGKEREQSETGAKPKDVGHGAKKPDEREEDEVLISEMPKSSVLLLQSVARSFLAVKRHRHMIHQHAKRTKIVRYVRTSSGFLS